MDASESQNSALQKEEYEVLESIYPEYITSDISNGRIRLEIPIEFPEPQTIQLIQNPLPIHEGCTPDVITLSLNTLPPLIMSITLPELYPLQAAPRLVSITATHAWLPHLIRFPEYLTKMWQPGEGVLYHWIEFVRNGDFLQSFREGDIIQIPHASPRALAPLLKDSEASKQSSDFAKNSYPCSICLEHFKGSKCIQLLCSHIFCRACLEDFWKLCISEGDVGRVGCPDPACVKQKTEADVTEVARVVTDAELKRWRWLREKRDLEKDPSIIHCPMEYCQTPIPKPPGISELDDDSSGWARLRTCPSCSYSFCAFCRRTWHGPHTPCPIGHVETVVLEYLNLPEDSSGRLAIERRFGRTNVLKLVKTYQEEQANRQWLEASTMACPGCNVHVEKSLGCNHMTCSKCRQHFCYRCGTKISASDPYKHFSTPGRPCYNKLFDFESGEDEWQPMEAFDMI